MACTYIDDTLYGTKSFLDIFKNFYTLFNIFINLNIFMKLHKSYLNDYNIGSLFDKWIYSFGPNNISQKFDKHIFTNLCWHIRSTRILSGSYWLFTKFYSPLYIISIPLSSPKNLFTQTNSYQLLAIVSRYIKNKIFFSIILRAFLFSLYSRSAKSCNQFYRAYFQKDIMDWLTCF